MSKNKRLTKRNLRAFVLSEAEKLQKEALAKKIEDVSKTKADEYEAGDEAGTIEKDIDFIKALNIHEKRVLKKLKMIREHKKRLKKNLLRKLK